MSEFTEEFERAQRALEEQVSDQSIIMDINDPAVQELMADGALKYSGLINGRLVQRIRRVYRRHAGEDFPPDGETYFDNVKDECVRELVEPIILAIADGILVAKESSYSVQKAKSTGDFEQLFRSKAFRQESEAHGISLLADQDLEEMVRRDLTRAGESFADITGFRRTQDGATLRKIWDLWVMSALAVSTMFYKVGLNMGHSWKERDVLEGIAAATESSESHE